MPTNSHQTLRLRCRRNGLRIVGGLALAAVLCVSSLAVPAQSVFIVANPEPAADSLDASTLRGIFGMRMSRWPDGTPIKVFVLPDDDPVHEHFAKSLLNTYPHQLRRNWDRMLYSGTGHAPVQVADEQEMLQKIRTTPGAIGYVGSIQENDHVRVIESR